MNFPFQGERLDQFSSQVHAARSAMRSGDFASFLELHARTVAEFADDLAEIERRRQILRRYDLVRPVRLCSSCFRELRLSTLFNERGVAVRMICQSCKATDRTDKKCVCWDDALEALIHLGYSEAAA